MGCPQSPKRPLLIISTSFISWAFGKGALLASHNSLNTSSYERPTATEPSLEHVGQRLMRKFSSVERGLAGGAVPPNTRAPRGLALDATGPTSG